MSIRINEVSLKCIFELLIGTDVCLIILYDFKKSNNYVVCFSRDLCESWCLFGVLLQINEEQMVATFHRYSMQQDNNYANR